MSIDDPMRTEVVTAASEIPVDEVAAVMRDENVGSVVVVSDGVPVGLVTDQDIAVRVAAEGDDPDTLTAEAAMSSDLVTADDDTGVFDLCATICDYGFGGCRSLTTANSSVS